MKTILEALEFCRENKLYSENIKIALGIYKIPMSIREGINQLKIQKNENKDT